MSLAFFVLLWLSLPSFAFLCLPLPLPSNATHASAHIPRRALLAVDELGREPLAVARGGRGALAGAER